MTGIRIRAIELWLAAALSAAPGAQVAWRPEPGGPSARDGHGAVADPTGSRLLLFGGRDGSGLVLGDTWSWDGSRWLALGVGAGTPPARRGHALAADPARARIVLFGGLDAAGAVLADTWEWDGRDWALVQGGGGPVGRSAHAMATAAASAGVLLFGGADANGGALADTWVFDGVVWRPRSPAGITPSARFGHALAYDARRDRTVLHGGQGANSDTWEWDGVAWTRAAPAAAPGARVRHVLAFDSLRECTVLVGGDAGGVFAVQDTWEWDGTTWRQRTLAAEPQPRLGAAFAFAPGTGRCLLFGGLDAFGARSDAHSYGTDTPGDARAFGVGCPGSSGVPVLAATDDRRPWLGDRFALELAPLVIPGAAVLLGGFSNTAVGGVPLPIPLDPLGMPGCVLLIDPAATALMAPAGTARATQLLDVPSTPVLAGAKIHFQAAAYEPGANVLGVLTSNGLTLTLGAR